ncbi:tetratricopeptide repeat protein [Streptomyces mirabilis]
MRVADTSGARVIAQHGSLAVGYAEQIRFQAPARQPAAWPHLVGVIPPRAPAFQHRAVAEQLRQAVSGGGTAVLGQVLSGLGGVGKTQLAADYARTAWEHGELDVLVWVTASSRELVVAGFTQAAVELLAVDPDEHAANAFLAWLQTTPRRERAYRWLVVLDDVTDPADLRGLWPPANPHGRTLVTTRRRDAALTAAGRRLLNVGLFTPEEAAAHLAQALADHHRHEPADQLHDLAAGLGYLPLALSQAAAYLIDTGMTCARYRELLTDRTRTLSELLPEPGILPDDQATTVAATWSLSIERAERLRPQGLARPMLQLIAMLDPSGIPDTVLTSPPALDYLADLRTRTAASATTGPEPGRVTQEDAVGALRALHRLNLIDHTLGTPHQAVRVHRLIQRATVDTLTPDQRDQLARTAADALLAAWPDTEHYTALAHSLRGNTDALAGTAEAALYRPDAHAVLYRSGNSLGHSGQATAARDHFQRLVTEIGNRLGPDHSDTLEARHNLARWRGEAGDATGAAAAFAELLADQEQVLGPDHLDTLRCRHHFAWWRGEAGDVVGAAEASEQLVADRERVQGPDHRHTLNARAIFARWTGDAGDRASAINICEQLLEDAIRVLGPDDGDTLVYRSNLANERGGAGYAAAAVAAFAELLVDQERVLGPDHPHTLDTRIKLAQWRGKAGDPDGAVAAFAELLVDQNRALGPDHRETLLVRYNIAYWRREAGDPDGAAAALAELLGDVERVLGPDHPHTLDTRHDLSSWRETDHKD